MKIAIVDYEVGNLPSVQNAFRAVGLETVITRDPAVIDAAPAVVLPGVGAFPRAADALRQAGLEEPVKRAARSGKPFLGICVGMQLLFELGEEGRPTQGLGLLPGRVSRLPETGLKLPHVGWNEVTVEQQHPLFAGLPERFYAYFVHSYAAETNPEWVVASCDYARPFPAIVVRDNVLGIQFHPEKSSQAGLQLLANFGRLLQEVPR